MVCATLPIHVNKGFFAHSSYKTHLESLSHSLFSLSFQAAKTRQTISFLDVEATGNRVSFDYNQVKPTLWDRTD